MHSIIGLISRFSDFFRFIRTKSAIHHSGLCDTKYVFTPSLEYRNPDFRPSYRETW